MDQILKDVAEFVKGCLGPLGGGNDWPSWIRDFLIQFLATILLFLVIRIFLWKPITKLLESRKAIIDKELTDAKEHNENAAKLENELKIKYEQSRQEIEKLINESVETGKRKRDEIIAEANKEAKRRINMAEEEIQFEISKKQQDIKDQIVTIAFMAAEKILGKEVDKKQYLEMVTQIIDSGYKDAK